MVQQVFQTSRRSSLATAFSSLKRVRPTVPFWELAAHRIPTLWSLYRGLLRAVKGHDYVRWRVGVVFRKNQHLTSPQRTKEKLERAYEWLSVFEAGAKGDKHGQAVLHKYNNLINARIKRIQTEEMIIEQMEWHEQLKNRPILTGSLMRPTLYNIPLPRMKPQPVHISGMIYSRRKSRERRIAQQEQYIWDIQELRAENKFEASLFQDVKRKGLTFDKVYEDIKAWEEPLQQALKDFQSCFDRDAARANLPYTPELLEIAKQARKMKIENKTRERERERKGQVLPITLDRMRGQPPPHVQVKMTPREKEIDRIKRLPSEGGYTGRIKSEAGMKLKDNVTWRLEETGDPARQEELKQLEEEFKMLQQEREMRRKKWKDDDGVE